MSNMIFDLLKRHQKWTIKSLAIFLFFSCIGTTADWADWKDANAVFSMARAGNRLYCGMRSGEIRTWRLSGPLDSIAESDRVDPSVEADATDAVTEGGLKL
jgi:hypothetical protein